MQDELTISPPAARRGSGRTIAATFAGALLLGAAATAWVSWHYGWLSVDMPWSSAPAPAPQRAAALPSSPQAALDAASAAKLAVLESRIAEIDQEAAAASGNATRAESLLIAFAARRAIERGQPLGYLESQLRVRFGESQPQSVDRLIRASTRPVTLDRLSEEIATLEPQLGRSAPSEGTLDWIQREAGELFIIRHADSPSPDPAQRMLRVRQYLAGGRVDAAIDEITRMPGHDAAKDWLARAQDYVLTQRALDIIENAALLQPQPATAVQPAGQPAASPQPGASPVAP